MTGAPRFPARLLEIAAAHGVDVAAVQSTRVEPVGQAPRAVRNANDRKLDARAELAPRVVVAGVEVGPARPKRPRRSFFAESVERRARMRSVSIDRGVPSFAPEDFSREAFIVAARAMRGGASARDVVAAMRRSYAQRVRWAALAYLPDEHGKLRPTRSWNHPAARRIVGVAAVMFRESLNTRRRGMHLLLQGFARGSLCVLFPNRETGKPVHVSTLYATSYDAQRKGPWDCGAVVALHRSGALVRHQPPASTAPAQYVGRGRDGSPRALNQYWLTEKACSDEAQDDAAPAFYDWTPADDSPPEARGPPS